MPEKLNTWMVLLIRSWENNVANKFPLSICSRYFPVGFILINFILYFPSLVSLFSLGKYNLSDSWWSFEILSILGIVFSFLALDCIVKQFLRFYERTESNPILKDAKEKLFKRVNNNKIPIIISALTIFVLFMADMQRTSLRLFLIYCVLIIIFITLLWLMINFLIYLCNIKHATKNLNNGSLLLLEDLCYKIFILWIIGTSITLLILLTPTFLYSSRPFEHIAPLIILIELIAVGLFLRIYKKILKLSLKGKPNIEHTKIWFKSIINLFPFGYPMYIFINGYLFYFVAIIIINSDDAVSNRWFNFVNLFLIGISLTFTVFRSMYNSLFNTVFKDIENIFYKKDAFIQAKNSALNYIDDNKQHAIFSMPLMTGVLMGVILWNQRAHSNVPLITQIVNDPALLYLIIVIYFAAAIMGTGISLGMRYGDLVDEFRKVLKINDLNKNRLLVSPDRTFGLKSLGNFIVKSALIWFIGLGIISVPLIDYIISFNKYLPLAYLIPVSLVGLITFFYVYLFIFNDIIKQLQSDLINHVSFNIINSSEQYEMLDTNKKIDRILMFAQLNEIFSVDEYSNKVYNTLSVILSTAIGWIPYIVKL